MAFFSASITIAGMSFSQLKEVTVSFVDSAGAFGGLIATGVGFMSGLGGLYGWQWL